MENSSGRVNGRYILVTAVAVFLSWVLHELAHWTAGTLLGYEMGMTLNTTFPVDGKYSSDAHYQTISAAGPLFTLLEAAVIFLVMKRSRQVLLYPFLLTSLYCRALAGFITLINSNDEARISRYLHLGTFTLPLLMTAVLFWLVYRISKDYQLSMRFILKTVLLIMLFSSIIILSDQFFQIRLI